MSVYVYRVVVVHNFWYESFDNFLLERRTKQLLGRPTARGAQSMVERILIKAVRKQTTNTIQFNCIVTKTYSYDNNSNDNNNKKKTVLTSYIITSRLVDEVTVMRGDVHFRKS